MATNLTGTTIAATYPQLLHVDGGLSSTEKTVYSGVGTPSALKLGTTSASVDSIQFNNNVISTLGANQDLFLSPNGTGKVVIGAALISGGEITGITDLALADGGTGASDAAGARTNLGLGTMALQSAAAVNITGGTITGVSFPGSQTGLTLVESVTITGVTVNGGNLRMTGNVLSSTNTDGNIVLQPNGAGIVTFPTAVGSNLAAAVVAATTALGYATGAGGVVTQATDKSTGVTLNKLTGQITTHDESMASNTVKNFVVSNSLVAATDVVQICIGSGGTVGEYSVGVDAVGAGQFTVAVRHFGSGSLGEALVLNFAVLKGVIA